MDTPKTQTKPELQKPNNIEDIGLEIAESSSIDIGINTFNEKEAVVIFIRPDYVKTTRWLNGSRGLETRTFDVEVSELRNKFLQKLNKEEFSFKFETQTPTWGYIFDIKYKVSMYDLVRGVRGLNI